MQADAKLNRATRYLAKILVTLVALILLTSVGAAAGDWGDGVVCHFDPNSSGAEFTIYVFAQGPNGGVIWTSDETAPGMPAQLVDAGENTAFALVDDQGNAALVSFFFFKPNNLDEAGAGLLSRHIYVRDGQRVSASWQTQSGYCLQRGKGLQLWTH